jgi:hypothetical protein
VKHIMYFDQWGEVKSIGHTFDFLSDLEWSIPFGEQFGRPSDV